MKILVISNNPSRASFRQRIGIYLDRLAESGIDCRVEKLPASCVRRWRLLQQAKHCDAVLIHKKTLNLWDARLLRRSARKIIYDFDDAIMYSPTRPQTNRTSHMRLFQRTARLADQVIAGNDYLAEHARQYNSCVHVLPTGLDTAAFRTLTKTTKDDRIRLVWIGSRSTLPYLEEILPVLRQIGRQPPGVVLRVIADAFPDADNVEIEKCTWSLDRQNQQLIDADIGLAPLPDNRFTRGKCGFKILQYFAASLPVVGSPVGVNRQFIQESGAGIIAENHTQWKEALIRLIREEPLRRTQARNASEYVRRFDRKEIALRLMDIIKVS